VVHREPIIALAARHKLPAIYWQRFFVAGKHTKCAPPVTALALRTRWHRPINLPGSA
jgi:hypothetical protein